MRCARGSVGVVLPACLPRSATSILEDGVVCAAGRIGTTPEALRLFAQSLAATDEVAIEATVNTFAIARLLEEHVARVVISNPLRTRANAEAKVKTDKVDARVLAELPRGRLSPRYLPSGRGPSGAAFLGL